MKLVVCVVLGVILNLSSAPALFASSSAGDVRNICVQAQQSLQRLSFCLDLTPTAENEGEQLSAIEQGDHLCASIMQIDRRQSNPTVLKTMAWLLKNIKKSIAQTYRHLGSGASGLDKVKLLHKALEAYQCSVISAGEWNPSYGLDDQLDDAVTAETIVRLQSEVARQVAMFTGCALPVRAAAAASAGVPAVAPVSMTTMGAPALGAPATTAAASGVNSYLSSPVADEHGDAMYDGPVPEAEQASAAANAFLLHSPPPMRFGASSESAGFQLPSFGMGLGSPLHLGRAASQDGETPVGQQAEEGNVLLGGGFDDELFMDNDGLDYNGQGYESPRSESPPMEESREERAAAASSAPAPRIEAPSPNLQGNERFSCHSCKSHKPVAKLKFCAGHRIADAKAKSRKCRKKFCDDCVKRKFSTFIQAGDAAWQCPACAGVCLCAPCTRKKMSSH